MNKANHPYLELLYSRTPIIFDGAMGTQIQELGVRPSDFRDHEGCNEILNVSRPDLITRIHTNYLRSGAHVIETNTFGANRAKLMEYGLDGSVAEINKTAAQLGRAAVAEACCNHACFVCGTMGPTGILSSQSAGRKKFDFNGTAALFREQATALLDGGADLLLLETMHDLLELRAAVSGIRGLLDERAITIPLQAHASMDAAGRMLLGSDLIAFLAAAAGMGVDVVGLNCNTGPHEMKRHVEELLGLSPLPVCMMPNAGMPKNVNGKAVYDMGPDEFCNTIVPLVSERGLNVTGGCCGTTPAHITALAKALDGKKAARRTITPKTFCGSGISGKDLETEKKPFIIGERLNTQGSKKTKELVLAKNYDELYQVALGQAQMGSSILDLCVAVSEADNEKETMAALVSFLSERVALPFSIDSTDPAVIEAALKACPGAALVNSINLEAGGKRARAILRHAKQFGCPVIALTIDDDGMAKTVEKKMEIARRLRDLACGQFNLPEHFLYIDPLTFTLAAGDAEGANAAKASLEALARIKTEMPGVRTVMGVSNVSYGLSPASRRVLNNVMLNHAAEAGLDAAIFNPLHLDRIDTYAPAVREKAEALLFNRAPQALADFITVFDDKKSGGAGMSREAEKTALSPEEQLRNKVINRDRRDLAPLINGLLEKHEPQRILDEILLPAMAMVGEKMDKGEMILSFVLQAAEVMREALSILEPRLASKNMARRGKIVLATVYGDVHDIGKNLVATILRNQGYNVVDLGKQVPSPDIVAAVKREKPDAVGLSALLVFTSREMAACVAALDREGISVPVLIGGAAVNRDFASRISRLESGGAYAGGVHYAKDAFEASKILEGIKKPQAFMEKKAEHPAAGRPPIEAKTQKPEQPPYPEMVTPQFYGTSQVLRWDVKSLLSTIDTKRLFKGYFGGGNLDKEAFKTACEKEFQPAYDQITRLISTENLVDAAGLYGIFPAYTDDDKLVILDPGDYSSHRAEFILPRVERKKNRSIADYFRPEGDVIAVQIVTMGKAIDEKCSAFLKNENKYALGFYLNGLANYLTELLADKVTAEIRRAFLIPADRGRRYSFGYPGLPGVEEQVKLFELLGVEERLGVSLTSGFQMVPEHSTMGIFVHHPEAEYL
ncbi:MAG TPA: homocysteine S-methyltransferase family protein [Chitinivibrionales bacterium]|nr:homocysteine S-methyltransferase family protein [Chitinivibrionales bacterium]